MWCNNTADRAIDQFGPPMPTPGRSDPQKQCEELPSYMKGLCRYQPGRPDYDSPDGDGNPVCMPSPWCCLHPAFATETVPFRCGPSGGQTLRGEDEAISLVLRNGSGGRCVAATCAGLADATACGSYNVAAKKAFSCACKQRPTISCGLRH